MSMLTRIPQVEDMDQYVVLSALRGPDGDNPVACMMKQITTSVLRHFVLQNPDTRLWFCDVRSPEDAQKYWARHSPQSQTQIIKLLRTEVHFHCHWEDAMLYMSRYNPQVAAYHTWVLSLIYP